MTWNVWAAIRVGSLGSPPIYTQKETKDETGNSYFSF